jgi:large subunit ribosomal protein L4
MLEAVNAEGKVLFVLNEHSLNIHLSVRNIPQVNSCTWDNINIYQVMWHDTLIITENAAEKLESKFVSISSDKEG